MTTDEVGAHLSSIPHKEIRAIRHSCTIQGYLII